MRKFLILLKKEVKEMLTLQIILPLLITTALFMFIGDVLNKEQAKMGQPQKVAIVNEDGQSKLSVTTIDLLKSFNLSITLYESVADDTALEMAKKDNMIALIIIPSGYENSLQTENPLKLKQYTIIKNFSFTGGQGYSSVSTALSQANEIISNSLIQTNYQIKNVETIKNPLQTDDFIVVGNNQAHANPLQVMGFVSQQTMFIPIILFFVIVFASQMIATAIANEKENKTLETLLTTPVSRTTIVISKMMGAGLIALLASGIYIIGFRSYLSGVTGGIKTSSDVAEIIQQLGLSFSPQDFLLLGITLFIGILVALSISLILGSFAEDVKSVAGLTSPIMVLVMIPYLLTMFIDINTISPLFKYIVYAIPFSHIFLAAPNIYLRNYPFVMFGILYQFIIFIIFVLIASWIFSTDKIVTMKLNFSRKRKIT